MIWTLISGTGFQSYTPTSIPVVTTAIIISLLHEILAENKKQGIPDSILVKLNRGQDFTYTCCAKLNKTILFRWGLYLHGSYRDPVPLYSRATVKGPSYLDLNNLWSKDFSASRYKNRVQVNFNPNTLCMSWTILRVREGDENTFFGVYRDDQGLGKQFKPCNSTLKLIVVKSTTKLPFSTPSTPTPSYLDLDTPPTSQKSHVTTDHNSNEDTEEPTDSAEPNGESKPDTDYSTIIAVTAVIILIIGAIAFIYSKRKEMHQWYNSKRFKERSEDAQNIASRSGEKLRRRR